MGRPLRHSPEWGGACHMIHRRARPGWFRRGTSRRLASSVSMARPSRHALRTAIGSPRANSPAWRTAHPGGFHESARNYTPRPLDELARILWSAPGISISMERAGAYSTKRSFLAVRDRPGTGWLLPVRGSRALGPFAEGGATSLRSHRDRSPSGQRQPTISGGSIPCSWACSWHWIWRLRNRSLAWAPALRSRGTRSMTSIARL